MINYIKRKDLDVQKYDDCIENSIQSRIYAFSWYLDIVADNWDALVLGDYEAVMPIPWRKKYFIKYVYQPLWTQQLGVFSLQKITTKEVEMFIRNIPKKFKKITLQFNSKNNLERKGGVAKNNYILSIKENFTTICKNFNKNRKRNLLKAQRANLFIDKEISSTELLKFYRSTKKNYIIDSKGIKVLENILISNRNEVNCWGIRDNDNLIAGLVWLKDNKRITYLLPIATVKGKEKAAPSLLILKIIQQFEKLPLHLDFEGSMLSGVAQFYKSFGAKKEQYYFFKSYNFFRK